MKSEKPLVRNWIIACTAVILLFHLAWFKYTFGEHVFGDLLFTIVDLLLLSLFVYFSIVAYRNADDPNKEYNRKGFVISSAISSIWSGAWSSQIAIDIIEGIR